MSMPDKNLGRANPSVEGFVYMSVAIAMKMKELLTLKRAPQEVTAAKLAAHVAFKTGKSYDAKNIKKTLNQAGCKPHIEGTGRRASVWLYGEIVNILRTFAKGRANGVNWPDSVKKLTGGKNCD